ncbi:lmo0937 family membrane protein [Acidipila sp. EB88]|nr:lmo0937 family membrane protein [Acidipila sp. EB88]RRA47729.1 lmo0937 family membrane protein [Acidipila sp. EB88]
MLLGIGVLLFIAWILGFVVFHVSAFFIHLLIIFAIISVILHFVRGARA